MFEQTFKNIDDILHKDAGCGSELDYVEQTSWILFLKYLDDLEKDRATAAELTSKTYTPIIEKKYQWTVWAAPKNKEGKLDRHKALSGDDLLDFVNGKLSPYLKKFKASAESADTIEYKIGEIFSELKNRIQSGHNLRLADFVKCQKTFADSENSWTVKVKDIDPDTFDLSVKNPNKKEEAGLRPPKKILKEMKYCLSLRLLRMGSRHTVSN